MQARLPVRARPGKSSEEISDEGAPEKTFAGRRPREERQGLEGPERARTIRRTAAKKRRRQDRARGSGALRRHALDPTAGRASGRPSTGWSAAETRASPASLLFDSPSQGQPNDSTAQGLPPAAAHQAPCHCGIGGPPPATTSKRRPRRRTARGDRPPKGPATTGAIRGGRGAGRLHSARRRGGTLSHC